jgi:AraC-like DNA-binding protein
VAPIVALIATGHDRLTIEPVLAAVATVRVCDRAESLRALVAAGGVRVVVSELRDRVGASVASVLAELAGRASAPPVLAWAPLTDSGARDVLALAGSGAPVQVVLRGVDDLAAMARAALDGRSEPGAALPILEAVAPAVPRPLGAFMVLCAEHGGPRLAVTRAASLLGVGSRTIESRLERAGFPPASRVIFWCAALRAAWRLDVLEQSPKQVAAALGFASSAALANLLSRYCGCSPSALRNHGGFLAVREQFVDYLLHSHANRRVE